MKKYARILKDGSYNDYHYKKGEIYEIKTIEHNFFYLDIKEHMSDVLVSRVYITPYGIEAELVTENKIIELW
jgi:hypothetical protein